MLERSDCSRSVLVHLWAIPAALQKGVSQEQAAFSATQAPGQAPA